MAGAVSGISANERLAMERSQGSSKGIASAVVAVSEPVLASATAVAALSCEALQAQVLLIPWLVRTFLSDAFQILKSSASWWPRSRVKLYRPRCSLASCISCPPFLSALTAQTALVITLES